MLVITGPKSDNVEEGFALFCIHEVIMASEKQGNIKREYGIEKDFFGIYQSVFVCLPQHNIRKKCRNIFISFRTIWLST